MSLHVETIRAADMDEDVRRTLADLRIRVFRAYPYLYDGDAEYEERYLESFARSANGVVVLAFNDDTIIGASTGAPLAEVDPEFAAPFNARGDDIASIFYCAESVVLPEYQGNGFGTVFFDQREAQARRLRMTTACFCSVIRPADHPNRPEGYRPLDQFWRKRGYAPLEGALISLSWKEVGSAGETEKALQVWSRSLSDL